MIRRLEIKRFRCFDEFEMSNLGRINLLVGKNNSGKTTVLEALELLLLRNHHRAVQRTLARRGELAIGDSLTKPGAIQYEVAHLFPEHRIDDALDSRIDADNGGQEPQCIEFKVDPGSDGNRSLLLLYRNGGAESKHTLPLTQMNTVLNDRAGWSANFEEPDKDRVFFLGGRSISPVEAMKLFDGIVLTRSEELLTHALQKIHPDIERLAPMTIPVDYERLSNRGGFLTRLKKVSQRVPIGSLGEGVWRMFGIALAIAANSNGYVLIDEIETGLHHSAMEKMWKVVLSASQELDVQVFATTHSRDCLDSLASICSEEKDRREVSLQRIEAGNPKAVHFPEPQIHAVAERGIEVR